ncbi:MAG: hypothetical protein WB586_03345 [Chthoniobacterales bacterium]
MLIRIGYDIAPRLPAPTAVIYVLHVHPARKGDLIQAGGLPDRARTARRGIL